MSVTIKEIYIENFRSIRKLAIVTDHLSVFVGKNDCGKSNILRALNLFFNGVTNPGQQFSFEEDYNLFAPERSKVAKETIVRIYFEIPQSYWATNGQRICWEKRWRSGGLNYEEYWGVRLSKTARKGESKEYITIPERSNAHALLRQIEFEYVPAIKDAHFFDALRGRIYSTIAQVAKQTFRTSSTAFEASIGEHLKDLTKRIGGSLGFQTQLALPRDLSHIFERLDFLSGEKAISLDHRGDGIKVRHIPLILEFMAQKKLSLQVRGAMPYSFIWAYEEPENNLEFTSAVHLADELCRYAKKGMAQVLLTTHSPVFYDLGNGKNENISRSHVYKDDDIYGTLISSDANLDEKMGTLALLAPRVEDLIQDERNRIIAQNEAEKLAQQNRCKIFIEGESDRVILGRCLEVYFPEHSKKIDLVTKTTGAGHSYVIDMLMGWRAYHKHHPTGPRAAGLLDSDAGAERKKWNQHSDNIASAKCFLYPKPPHAIEALSAGFKIAVTLEVLYDIDIWKWAQRKGYLEPRVLADVFPKDMTEKILRGEDPSGVAIDQSYAIYVTNNFCYDKKITVANHVAGLNEDRFKQQFSGLAKELGEIIRYLGL